MKKNTTGYIYILTNPSFEEYVKIGYADNVEERVKQLNTTECTPFAFRIYATYEVNNRLLDKELHSIIDNLNPSLRSVDEVDGKVRKREFYALTPEQAYSLLEGIAKINGLTFNLKRYDKTAEEIEDEQTAQTIYRLTKTMSENLYFWTEFNKVVLEKGKPFNIRKPYTDAWYDVAIGTSEAQISIRLISKKHIIVELYINNSKELFDKLFSQKDEIEKELGFKMQWKRLDDMKASRIQYFIKGLDFDNKDNYPDLMSKIIEKVVVLKNVFPKYI